MEIRNILNEIRVADGQALPTDLPAIIDSTGRRGGIGPRAAERMDAMYADVNRRVDEITEAAALAITPASFDEPHASRRDSRAQPLAADASRPPAGLAEWEAMFQQQLGHVPQLHHSRRRYCYRGWPSEAAGSDTSEDAAAAWFAAQTAREPACEGAVPAAAAADAYDLQENVRGSSIDDCRDGGFGVPAPEEEEQMLAASKQLQHSNAANKGLSRWWTGMVSRSFRKASIGLFGSNSSSNSRKGLQLADSVPRRSHAAARASVDTVSTEEEREREIEVECGADGSSGDGGGGQPAPVRVGYLTKLFSIRSRRDVLLAAGDQ
jgi:hypothetical protein